MNDFPDHLEQNSATWATLCYDRSPAFKVHSSKGLAHNAIGNKKPYTEIALYENQAGIWTKVWEWVKPDVCSCGREFSGDPYGRGKYNLDPDFEGTIKDCPVICKVCYSEKREIVKAAQEKERELRELARLKAKYDSETATHDEMQRYARLGGLENLTRKD